MSRVAIIGAGIGGLATAVGLQRRGWDVGVFERSGPDSQVGAGLSLFGNGFRALDALGAGDFVRAIAGPPNRMTAGQRRRDGRWLATTSPESIRELRVVHRADLHHVLTDQLEPGTVTYGKEVELPLDCYDVVVAADGLRSAARGTAIRYSGYISNATTPPPDERGRGEEFSSSFGVVSLPAGTKFPDEYAEVLRRFSGWHAPIADVLDATDPAAVVRTDIYDLAKPLPSFIKGNTVLLGDAAHAMTPDLGQGANMALEDAATLTRLLSALPVGAALQAYDESRRPRTQAVARKARLMGRLLQSRSPLRDVLLRLTPTSVTARQLTALQSWAPPA